MRIHKLPVQIELKRVAPVNVICPMNACFHFSALGYSKVHVMIPARFPDRHNCAQLADPNFAAGHYAILKSSTHRFVYTTGLSIAQPALRHEARDESFAVYG